MANKKGRQKNRVKKSLEQKVNDLDAHLYLLRKHLNGLTQSRSHLKAIAAELRTLLCRSSGTEGLLYRLIHELGVDDSVNLHVAGNLIEDHPLAQGLQLCIVPISRGGQGPVEIASYNHSFRGVIRHAQALIAVGKPLTHEYLIKALAQQMGTAHEDDGIEPALAQLNGILLNGVESFVDVLIMDAELTLEVGERVLEKAELQGILNRPAHDNDYGNVTIAFRVQVKAKLVQPIKLYRFHCYGSCATITCFITVSGVELLLEKHGSEIAKIFLSYPSDFHLGDDPVFALSYCSRTGQARTITSQGAGDLIQCPLGWIHAGDLQIAVEQDLEDLVEPRFLLGFEKLLSTEEVVRLQALPPSGHPIFITREEQAAQGSFPA